KEENPTEEPDKKGEDPEEKTDGEEDYSDIRLNRTIDGETVTYLCNSVVDAENAGVSYLKGLFENYHITVKIVFKKQKLKEFKISDYDISDEVSDGEYYDDISYSETALSAIYSKLQKNPNADIDAVSGATCSSTALIRVYKAAARDYKEYLKTLEKEKPSETPDEKAPDEKVPDEKEADEKTPEETSPDEKAPDEKAPDEKVPEEESENVKASDEKEHDEKVSDDKKSGKRIEENRIKEAPVSEERAEVES
ncbi:MAG: FMN-binding protein, partial [Lachnospiraceae bacterium]|nr:FMN-binding protein [Lachnospiraceae bacterium]